MIAKRFKKGFQKHPNSMEFGKDKPLKGINENPKVNLH